MTCIGVWAADRGLVQIESVRGPHVKSMGVWIQGQRYLYPEEAIFLLNRNGLRFRHAESGPDSYPYWLEILSESRSLSSAALAAYLYLRDRGFVVIRTRQYDRQIAQHRHKQLVSDHYQRVRDGVVGRDQAAPTAPDDLAVTDAPGWMRFCCWRPDQCQRFRSSNPSRPQFTIVAVSGHDPVPDCEAMMEMAKSRPDLVPFRVAVHELGHMSFVEFVDGPIPSAS